MTLIKIDHHEKRKKTLVRKQQSGFFVLTAKISYGIKLNLDFEAHFNYLANGHLITINTADMPDLIKQGVIIPKKQRVQVMDFHAQLSTHGFEVQHLPAPLQELLAEFKNSEPAEQHTIREKIREQLELLVSEYFGMPAVAFDTVYRNTCKKTHHLFKSVPLVHIDFPEQDISKTLEVFRKQWASRVTKVMGDKYHARDIEFMINVWMPLDYITASPLALCSKKGIDASRFHEYDAVRRDGTSFKAVSLTPPARKSDPWFYRPGMKGQCYLFSSTHGIHSAAEFPIEDGARESIEVRLGIFKN